MDIYGRVVDYFQQTMPDARTELHYGNAFQLLVAVRLSAQCTDKRINMVTPALFERFPDAASMAAGTFDEVLSYVKSVSYPNSKAKDIIEAARMIVNDFGGEVPADIPSLQKLPGVGPKTANVVASVLWGAQVMPVDTHVFRVSARLGLTHGAKTPLQAEAQLEKGFPNGVLNKAHHWLILHGRYTCKARKPLCHQCGLSDICVYYRQETE